MTLSKMVVFALKAIIAFYLAWFILAFGMFAMMALLGTLTP